MKSHADAWGIVRRLSILVMLLGLILLPRPAAGWLDLAQARRLETAGKYDQAAAAYGSAARRIPWQPALWEKVGDAYRNAGEYAQAESAYRSTLQRHALSPDGQMHLGDVYLALGEARPAVDLWNGLLSGGGSPSALLPRLAGGYRRLAEASADPAAQYGQEIQAWQEYLKIQPADAGAHYRLGLLLLATRPDQALPDLMRADQLDSALDPTVQGLRKTMNTALLSSQAADHFVAAGQVLAALNEWSLAALAFRNATTAQAGDAAAWAWLGEAEQHLGQDGKIEIERALTLDPGSATVESLYGLYLQRQKQPEQARQAFQKAADLEPANPAWQLALGSAYEQTGDLVAALAHYQQATALAPQDASVWQALAEFCLRDGVDLTGTGLPAARRLMELSNTDWHSFDIAGQILLETGDTVGAEDLLKRALALDPLQPAPALHLGLLYLQTGNRSGAYSFLNQAKIFDPQGPYGWQAGRLLEQYFP